MNFSISFSGVASTSRARRRCTVVALLAVVGSAGCPPPADPPPHGDPLTCTGASHLDGAGTACVQALHFNAASDIPTEGRDHHITFAWEAPGSSFVGIASGMRELPDGMEVFTSTFAGVVNADGSVGDWLEMPRAALFPPVGGGVATTASRVYATGGAGAVGFTTTVLSAELQPDGLIGAWRTEASFAAPARYHDVSFVFDGRVCVAGGFNGAAVFDDVQCATVGADGVLEPFALLVRLPQARSHFAVAVVDERAYFVGGFGNDDAILDVDVLSLDAAGAPQWSTTSALPSRHRTHAMTAVGHTLFLLNGEDGDGFELGHTFTGVLRAEVNDDGTLTPWEDAGDVNPTGRRHTHQAPLANGYLVSCLGTDEDAQGVANCQSASVY